MREPVTVASFHQGSTIKRYDGNVSRTRCCPPHRRAVISDEPNLEVVIVVHVRGDVQADAGAIRTRLEVISGRCMPVCHRVEALVAEIEEADGVFGKQDASEQMSDGKAGRQSLPPGIHRLQISALTLTTFRLRQWPIAQTA